MSTDVTEPNPRPAASNEDADALLDTANNASQHVAVLHVAFMALCAYVLVIVFGTTDMDLLIGKGVKLPVVDVTVPIVGFYAFAPYLVVLVHFNLLLQLQLLSRQLYAFDAAAAKEDGPRLILPSSIHPSVHAAPEEERIGGLRDRLHIFPYTYYLVGRPGPIVRRLLGVVVGITLLVLPLATLLVLQLRFLAYQDQAVTWAQRVAVWFDVALVIAVWPVIMDRGDSWRDYLRRLGSRLRQRWRMGLAWAAMWVGLVLPGFVTTQEVYFGALWAILWLLIVMVFAVARALAGLWRWWRGRSREPASALPAAFSLVRGMPGLLLVVALGVPLPLGLLADGEWWEEELLAGNVVASEVYGRFRRLDLSEQVLLAKSAKPELVAVFREGDPEKVKEALTQVEPVKLRGRSLRGASLAGALLPGADLREAQLQSAILTDAQLQGADLSTAQLQGADLREAQLQDADLRKAQLEGAILVAAQQGAVLAAARLQGAILTDAHLQAAVLSITQLQGADLRFAQLHGADLRSAVLSGGDLRFAVLSGADLRSVPGRTALVDLRAARGTPLNAEQLAEIREVLGRTTAYRVLGETRIEHAGNAGVPPPILESCLIDPEFTPELNCKQKWLSTEVEAFRRELFPVLEGLACESSAIAGGLIRQIFGDEYVIAGGLIRQTYIDETSGRWGLAARFVTLLDKQECEGLSSLPEADKDRIRDLAKREEERRGQSGAGKPAGEVPGAPNPPPAIAPETP